MARRLAPLLSSKRQDWPSPPPVLERVRSIAPIGLDPCNGVGSITAPQWSYYAPLPRHPRRWPYRVVRSVRRMLGGFDGLAQRWTGYGLVYVNSEYGRAVGVWLRKQLLEARAGAEIVSLVPARPDTAWWQTYVATADKVCFWRGRLTFHGALSAAPFPSAVLYWGHRPSRFVEAFGDAGWIPSERPAQLSTADLRSAGSRR